jgi:hypothetical protein
MHVTEMPIAGELFGQWRRARGDRLAPAARPFSRGWEALLADAGLVSAVERADATRDAQHLAKEGWVRLTSSRFRAHLIDRIAIPLEAETRWGEVFGFAPPSDEEARLIREFAWCSELGFVHDTRVSLPFEDLRRLHDFFVKGGSARRVIPIKERSLEIFGDEKRLDLVAATTLFGEGRLTLEHLRCFVVAEPLGWRRGPTNSGPLLVLENAATWDSFCRWNERAHQFSAVVYGGGNRFADSVGFIAEIFREVGGSRPLVYFGDLDVAGLRIPQRASLRAQRLGLPAVAAHLVSYRWLLRKAAERSQPAGTDEVIRREECDWLSDCAEEAWGVLSHGHRLAQEHLGADVLAELEQGGFS